MDIIVGNLSVPIPVIYNGRFVVVNSCDDRLISVNGRYFQVVENVIVKSAADRNTSRMCIKV